MANIHKLIRTLWIIFGILFSLWMINSYRAQGFDRTILESDQTVTVEKTDQYIRFQPVENPQPTGFIFLPGGMVAPDAYAPMSSAISEHGFNVFILKLPFGSAPLDSQEADVMRQALEIMDTNTTIQY